MAGASGAIELVWRGGPFAVVWKVSGVPVTDAVGQTSGQKGAGKQGAGSRGPTSEASLCSWVREKLDGMWRPINTLSRECAGLVFLARTGIPDPPALRGTYVALAAPVEAPPESIAQAEAGSEEAMAFWEDHLGLCGSLTDDASVVKDSCSAHFGRLAMLELETEVSGERSTSPVAAALALQQLGLAAVRLRRNVGRPEELVIQAPDQPDLLQGTSLALVSLRLPAVALAHQTKRASGGGHKLQDGCVVHTAPAKFSKAFAAEAALGEQRRKLESEGTVVFRGLDLLVPSEQLRPRISSGALVDAAKAALAGVEAPRILDLGTGSGALLLALLFELGPGASGAGVDLDEEAVRTCAENAVSVLGSDRAATAVRTVRADFTRLDEPAVRAQLAETGYDLIICNPPYRSEGQQEAYNRAMGQFGGYTEHSRTIVAGKTGFEMYQGIAVCLSRDWADSQQRAVAGEKGPGCVLKAAGTLIFQVEAGRGGQTGGVAELVGTEVDRASKGQLVMNGIHKDAGGLERGAVFCFRSGGSRPA